LQPFPHGGEAGPGVPYPVQAVQRHHPLEEDVRLAAASSGRSEAAGLIRQGHLLQMAFRVLLPGLVMISGRDAEGTLFAEKARDFVPSFAAWSLDGARMPMTRQGMPLGLSAYLSLSAQKETEGSFVLELSRLADIRQRTGVARGRVAAVADMEKPAAAGVLTALPGGGYLLLAGNFSGEPFVTNVRIPPGLIRPNEPGTDLLSGGAVAVGQDLLKLRMEPWQYRAVYLRAAG
jgi:hypothetical protein